MTVWELMQRLVDYPPDAEVCVSQKPLGYVVPVRLHDIEDGVVKLYGDGSLTPDGEEVRESRED